MRPVPFVPLVVLAALGGIAAACSAPPAGEPPAASRPLREAEDSPSGPRSEAERTREMEERAADLEAQAREARENAATMTEEEKLRAYEQFEADRQKLNEVGEGEPPE